MNFYKLDDYSAYGTGFFAEVAKMEVMVTIAYVMVALIIVLFVPFFSVGAMFMLLPFGHLAELIVLLWEKASENRRSIVECVRDKKGLSVVDVLKMSLVQAGCIIAIVLCAPFCVLSILMGLCVALSPVLIAFTVFWQDIVNQDWNVTVLLIVWSVYYVIGLVVGNIIMLKDY